MFQLVERLTRWFRRKPKPPTNPECPWNPSRVPIDMPTPPPRFLNTLNIEFTLPEDEGTPDKGPTSRDS
jgi:hypothetical protein